MFKKFKVMVEKATGRHIKAIRSGISFHGVLRRARHKAISNCTVHSSTKWCGREKKLDHSRHGLINAQEQKDAK